MRTIVNGSSNLYATRMSTYTRQTLVLLTVIPLGLEIPPSKNMNSLQSGDQSQHPLFPRLCACCLKIIPTLYRRPIAPRSQQTYHISLRLQLPQMKPSNLQMSSPYQRASKPAIQLALAQQTLTLFNQVKWGGITILTPRNHLYRRRPLMILFALIRKRYKVSRHFPDQRRLCLPRRRQ